MYENIYPKIIDALVTDGYIIIKNALHIELSSKLKQFTINESNFKPAGISKTSLHVDNTKRGDKIHWLDEDSGSQSEFLAFTSELQTNLNRELYLGINYYESHFSIYSDGDFYETHLDSFKNSKNRVVTTVYYLNDKWSDKDGGELVVYNEKNKHLITVIPEANTLVVFLSDKFPHEVLATKRKRFSIAGWFRIDK